MSEVKVHKVKYGNTERYSFSKIKDVLDIPYLIEVQKNSYKSFLEHGIKDVLDEYSPIRDFSGRMELSFIDYRLDGEPKYSVRECKNRDATYAVPLKVKARLTNLETGVIGRYSFDDGQRKFRHQRRGTRYRQPTCQKPGRLLQGRKGQERRNALFQPDDS